MIRLRRGNVPRVGAVSGGCSPTMAPPPSRMAAASAAWARGPAAGSPPPMTADGPAARLERRGVRHAVDADGEAADDRGAPTRRAQRRPVRRGRDRAGVGRRVPDDGDERLGATERRDVARAEQHRGRRVDHPQRAGIAGVPGGQRPAVELRRAGAGRHPGRAPPLARLRWSRAGGRSLRGTRGAAWPKRGRVQRPRRLQDVPSRRRTRPRDAARGARPGHRRTPGRSTRCAPRSRLAAGHAASHARWPRPRGGR